MNKNISVIVVLFISVLITAQNKYADIDKKILPISKTPIKSTREVAHFIDNQYKTDEEKIRAIYVFTANYLTYDLDNMFAINLHESEENKIQKALITKKGICENYAAIFLDLCLSSGIKSYPVVGYTKQNGFVDYVPHVWCAALINNKWILFDPTWASGYIQNKKFVKKFSEQYYAITPSNLIKTHMPFDYLWQFLNYPITSQEFSEGKTSINTSKPYFDFLNAIQEYENQKKIEQAKSSIVRIEKNGVKHALIFEYLKNLKVEVENEKYDIYNSSTIDYNNSIRYYNEFINYRNHQFNPPKSDLEIKEMLDLARTATIQTKNKLLKIEKPEARLNQLMAQLYLSIDEMNLKIDEQETWLKEYLSKSKFKRKFMFLR